mmetsp:Transcript_1303/g.3311  ORF Transcript_1303/g.3311 Transcript_1303/m.3311 type:complete len:113 (-) Transcript_1303:286-624(-)
MENASTQTKASTLRTVTLATYSRHAVDSVFTLCGIVASSLWTQMVILVFMLAFAMREMLLTSILCRQEVMTQRMAPLIAQAKSCFHKPKRKTSRVVSRELTTFDVSGILKGI